VVGEREALVGVVLEVVVMPGLRCSVRVVGLGGVGIRQFRCGGIVMGRDSENVSGRVK